MDDDLRSRYRTAPPAPAQPPNRGQPPPPRVNFAMPRASQIPQQQARSVNPIPNNPFMQAQAQPQTAPRPLPPNAFTPSQPTVKRRWFNGLVLSVLIMFILAGAGAGYYFGFAKHQPAKSEAASTPPIPADIINHATFPIYYPLPTPDHFSYQQGTASSVNGLFYFKLADANKSVAFIEQTLPPKVPDLSKIPNFGRIDIPAGQAAVGTVAGQPTAIVITKNTLINVSSNGSVSLTDIKDLVNGLVPSNNPSSD